MKGFYIATIRLPLATFWQYNAAASVVAQALSVSQNEVDLLESCNSTEARHTACLGEAHESLPRCQPFLRPRDTTFCKFDSSCRPA